MSDYPRVTEVLRPYATYHGVPTHILENAATRGAAVHAICADIADNSWVPESCICEAYNGYVKSFIAWKDAQVQDFRIIEQRFTDDAMRFSGQVDFVIMGTDAKPYLVDLKTSVKPQRTYPLQLAAYRHLLSLKNHHVEGCMLVYLNRNGDFPDVMLIHDTSKEFDAFTGALKCWHYFNGAKHD